MQYQYMVTDPTYLLNKEQREQYDAQRGNKTDEQICDYLTACLHSLDKDAFVAIIPTNNESHFNHMGKDDNGVHIQGVRFVVETGMVAIVQLTQKNQLTMFQEYSIDLIINREMGQIVIFDSDDVPYVESDNDEDGTAHFEIKNQEQVFSHTQKPKFEK